MHRSSMRITAREIVHIQIIFLINTNHQIGVRFEQNVLHSQGRTERESHTHTWRAEQMDSAS